LLIVKEALAVNAIPPPIADGVRAPGSAFLSPFPASQLWGKPFVTLDICLSAIVWYLRIPNPAQGRCADMTVAIVRGDNHILAAVVFFGTPTLLSAQ
jgi:hypothetical protein